MYTGSSILRAVGIVAFVYCMLTVSGCRGDEIIYPTIGTHVTDDQRVGGVYVLNEGNMGSNKARLDYINLRSGTYYSNWYGSQNPTQTKELGDVGNDIRQYGGRLYAVINCSHKVEVMDSKACRIGQVDVPNCRYLDFRGSKMYVSAYVGSVADSDLLGSVYEVDTATLKVTREVKVGHQPDELCVDGDKLYVCNSGGYLTDRYDSTVSVIDIGTFTEINRLVVGLNPTRIRRDNSGHLWVCCQGNYGNVKPELVVLNNDEVLKRIQMPCANISILDQTAYILDVEAGRMRGISTIDFAEIELPFDLSGFEHPYGMLATADALYITDAKNYVSSGVLHCYDYSGRERWSAKTGDIPGHLCCVVQEYELYHNDTSVVRTPSPFISRVYEYVPAMGQFVNELPKYSEGDDMHMMCRKCEQALVNDARGLVSLGGWGGYITFGFDHAVQNGQGYDLRILGNAFCMTGNPAYGSSEPGIVLVSCDDNQNGVPDDKWYELRGSMYDDSGTLHHYTRTYTRAGDTLQNTFHQHPYYPQWIVADELTFHGSLLPFQSQVINGQNVQQILDYGYVDNKPNSDIEGTSFDISWAVDADGQHILLPSVDYVRVYTAVDEWRGLTGELSTEIAGAVDLHCKQ